MLKSWLREPLLHFLLIGAVLFLLYYLQNDLNDEDLVADSNRIVISGAHIDRLVTMWEKRRQRPPIPSELEGLIEHRIREEVLNREALSMGLDKDDSVIRRRLAQKVEFIFADIAAQAEPTDTQLVDYLNANPEKFEIPGRISFVQVYFNTDKRGEQGHRDAGKLMAKLMQPGSYIDIGSVGDVFMFGQQHEHVTEQDVSRLFGEGFSKELFNLPIGGWQGPISSSYGSHLVRIASKTLSAQPDLEAVRDKVRIEWEAEQRQQMDESFYQSLRQRYEIVIEDRIEAE
ncbi:MAG: peptidylprolyl isomerase [Pseudomonadota bacterium]